MRSTTTQTPMQHVKASFRIGYKPRLSHTHFPSSPLGDPISQHYLPHSSLLIYHGGDFHLLHHFTALTLSFPASGLWRFLCPCFRRHTTGDHPPLATTTPLYSYCHYLSHLPTRGSHSLPYHTTCGHRTTILSSLIPSVARAA